jgi:hypothetical protein
MILEDGDPLARRRHGWGMTADITITVPFAHSYDPTCPHCGEELGDDLASKYPDSDPDALGGEHRCSSCDGPLYVSIFRPSPVFAVVVPIAEDNVTWLPGSRRRARPAGAL